MVSNCHHCNLAAFPSIFQANLFIMSKLAFSAPSIQKTAQSISKTFLRKKGAS
jgi:hypothetical protein